MENTEAKVEIIEIPRNIKNEKNEKKKKSDKSLFIYNFVNYFYELLLLISGIITCLVSFIDQVKKNTVLSWMLFIFGILLFSCGLIKMLIKMFKRNVINIISLVEILHFCNNQLSIPSSPFKKEFDTTILYIFRNKDDNNLESVV